MADEFAGAVAEVEGGRSLRVDLLGKSYAVADKVGAMPLLRFAHLAKKGVDSMDLEGLDAVYTMLRSVFTDEAWSEFEQDASAARLDGDDLLAVVQKAIELIAARPTGLPSESPAGQSTTGPNSTAPSGFAEYKRSLGLVPVADVAMGGLAG